MNFETRQALDRLQQDIEARHHEGFRGKAWTDFDVMVCRREDETIRHWRKSPSSHVHEYHHKEPYRRVVETRFASELSWLFERLRHIHVNEIERQTDYDFYADLAETANLFIEEHQATLTALSLMEAVLNRVRRIYR